MTRQDSLDLVPSRNESLLAGIVGKRISSITHYSDVAPAALLDESVYSKRGVRRIAAPRTPVARVGLFRELRYSKPDGPSLQDAVRSAPQDAERNIVEYLRAGKVLMMAPGVVSDVLDPSKGIITSLSILTDGSFAWRSDLAYYVERYHVALPDNFVTHMRDNGWAVPANIDLQSLELA